MLKSAEIYFSQGNWKKKTKQQPPVRPLHPAGIDTIQWRQHPAIHQGNEDITTHHRQISQIRLHRAIGTHGWAILHQTLPTPLVRPRKAHYKGFSLHSIIWQNHRHPAYGRTLQDRQRLRCSELVQRLLRRIPEPGCRTRARSRQSLWPWSILPPWPSVPSQPERNRIRRGLDRLWILAADIQRLLHAAAL